MRCIIISDTHNGHRKLEVPPGDLLIHCGDMTNGGSAPELRQVNEWLGTLPHPHKVVIAGALNSLAEPCSPHAADSVINSSASYPLCHMGFRVLWA